MEFFNIGGLELLLILVIALVALGPDRIVEVGRKLGTWLRKLNKNVLFREVVQTTDEIRNYPRKILDEAKLDPEDLDFSKQIKYEYQDLKTELDDMQLNAKNPKDEKSEGASHDPLTQQPHKDGTSARDSEDGWDEPQGPIGP